MADYIVVLGGAYLRTYRPGPQVGRADFDQIGSPRFAALFDRAGATAAAFDVAVTRWMACGGYSEPGPMIRPARGGRATEVFADSPTLP